MNGIRMSGEPLISELGSEADLVLLIEQQTSGLHNRAAEGSGPSIFVPPALTPEALSHETPTCSLQCPQLAPETLP